MPFVLRMFVLPVSGLALVLAALASPPLTAEVTKVSAPAIPTRSVDAALIAKVAEKYFPGHEGAAPAKRLFRLTRRQLDATVASLLPGYAIGSVTEHMPRDPLQTNYEYADLLALNGANLVPLTEWIGGITARVRADPSKLFPCPGATPAQACLDGAARVFIAKALRGDVAPERADRLVAYFLAGVKSAGLAAAASDHPAKRGARSASPATVASAASAASR